MTDKMREEFEKSPRFRGMDFTRSATHQEFYDSPYANGAWDGWQASRAALVIELPVISDELLTAAYWDFDARRKGYPPYKVPAGHECSDFKVSITSTIVASVLGETVSVPKELV